MIVSRDTIDDYLEDKPLKEWSNQWIFYSIVEKQYLAENVLKDKKDIIKKVTDLLENELNSFQPYNKDIWNVIFPDWEKIVSNSKVYLVVGCPNPYDAMTIVSPDGEEVIVFDVNRMLSYGDKIEKLVSTIKNLLTHEFSHTCLHCDYPIPDENSSFLYKLQYLCFDEGIAHFLSYNKNIGNVNWLDYDMVKRKECSYAMLKNAVNSDNNHEKLLKKAGSGGFWDKYGAISGLFTIADIFSQNSYSSILETYKKGPEKFLLDFFIK